MFMTDRGAPAEHERSFLAGLFDAEGSCWNPETHGGAVLRISNTNMVLLERAAECLAAFKFASILEGPRDRDPGRRRPMWDLRLVGGWREIMRFFAIVQPRANWKVPLVNRRVGGRSAEIVSIDAIGQRRLVDLTTTTCTFVAAGLLTHNCCQFMGRRTMKITGGEEFDVRYIALRGGVAVDAPARRFDLPIAIHAPCAAHDAEAHRCTVYADRPRTCRDFPWSPEQVQGIPCSYWFERLNQGRREVIAGDGAPQEVTCHASSSRP